MDETVELAAWGPKAGSNPSVGLAMFLKRWMRSQHLKISTFYLNIRSSGSSYKIGRPENTGHTSYQEVLGSNEWKSPVPFRISACSVWGISDTLPFSLRLSPWHLWALAWIPALANAWPTPLIWAWTGEISWLCDDRTRTYPSALQLWKFYPILGVLILWVFPASLKMSLLSLCLQGCVCVSVFALSVSHYNEGLMGRLPKGLYTALTVCRVLKDPRITYSWKTWKNTKRNRIRAIFMFNEQREGLRGETDIWKTLWKLSEERWSTGCVPGGDRNWKSM